MPVMAQGERLFCRSALWAAVARRVILPWILQRQTLQGAVLELGCGSGAMAARIARDFPGVALLATDLDPAMVAQAGRRLAAYPNAEVSVADVTALPFPDRSFDLVTSYLMLHHVIDWEQALRESFRVLRPGGQLLGYDLIDTLAARAIHFVDRSPHRLIAPSEFERTSRDVGFVDPVVEVALRGQIFRFSAIRS